MEETWSLEEVFPGSGSRIYQLQAASSAKTLLQKFASKKQVLSKKKEAFDDRPQEQGNSKP